MNSRVLHHRRIVACWISNLGRCPTHYKIWLDIIWYFYHAWSIKNFVITIKILYFTFSIVYTLYVYIEETLYVYIQYMCTLYCMYTWKYHANGPAFGKSFSVPTLNWSTATSKSAKQIHPSIFCHRLTTPCWCGGWRGGVSESHVHDVEWNWFSAFDPCSSACGGTRCRSSSVHLAKDNN